MLLMNKKVTEVAIEISDLTNLVTKAAHNTKATENENEIPDTT